LLGEVFGWTFRPGPVEQFGVEHVPVDALANMRAGFLPGRDQALGLEDRQRLPDRGAADLELRGQLDLTRQRPALMPRPGDDQPRDLTGDMVVGLTLHGASFQHRFFTLLQNYIPEFEAQSGMKVDLQLSAFPVYNQQANLELASGGSAFDFVNVTFFLAARWVAAGLLANLDEFSSDPNLTPAEWQPRISSRARKCRTATPRVPPTVIPGKAAPW
jgi:hypothetical protein